MANIINDLKKLQGVIMDNEGNYLPKLTGGFIRMLNFRKEDLSFLKG